MGWLNTLRARAARRGAVSEPPPHPREPQRSEPTPDASATQTREFAALLGRLDGHLLSPITQLLALQDELLDRLAGMAPDDARAGVAEQRRLARDLRERILATLAMTRVTGGLPLSQEPLALIPTLCRGMELWERAKREGAGREGAGRAITLDITLSPDTPPGVLVDPVLFKSCFNAVALALLGNLPDTAVFTHICPGEGCLQFDLAADAPAPGLTSDPAFQSAQALARHLRGVITVLSAPNAPLELELRIPARAIAVPATDVALPPSIRVEAPLIGMSPETAPGTFSETAPGTATPPAPGLRVGLAEDVVVNQQVFRAQAHPFGVAVEAHNTAEALLDAHAATPFPLLVMDLHMPGMGGLAAIQALRARGDATPVIVVTADATAATHAAAVDSGADVILAKPLASRDLGEALRYCRDLGVQRGTA